MSFQSLAPTEKSEHLIYSILPVSFATWVTAQLSLSDAVQILGTVVALSSFGTLLLYELTPEQVLVNEFFRRRVRSRQTLKDAVLILSMTVRLWETEVLSLDPTKDFIEEQSRRQVATAVANPHVRKRLWRIRASIYVIISSFFILNSAWIFIDARLKTGMPAGLNPLAAFALSLLHGYVFWLWILLLVLVAVGLYYRHQHLSANIDHLTRFAHTGRLLSVLKLKHHEYFDSQEGRTHDEIGCRHLDFWNLDNEIQILTNMLSQDDWSGFIERWNRIYDWAHKEAVALIEEYIAYDVMKPFADMYDQTRQRRTGTMPSQPDQAERAKLWLEWVYYFMEKSTKYGKGRDELKSLPLPKFDVITDKGFQHLFTHLQKLKEDDANNPIFIDSDFDPNALLGILAGVGPAHKTGVSGAALWAIAHLQVSEKKRYNEGAEQGMRVLVGAIQGQLQDLDPTLAVPVFLRAYEAGGIGYDYALVQDYEVLKKVKPDAEKLKMQDHWEKALVRFIEKAEDKNVILPLLADTSFLKPLVDGRTKVHDSIRWLKNSSPLKDDRDVTMALNSYGI